jgi:O-antigen biosynthesis protein
MNNPSTNQAVDRLKSLLSLPDSRENIEKLREEIGTISGEKGIQVAYNALRWTEVILKRRRPSLAIYDHAFHFIGGAQKYGLTLVNALKPWCDITILANKPVTHDDFRTWYQLELGDCPIKILPIPFFEARNTAHLDPALVPGEMPNPFHGVSRESGNYDIFINNSMNEMVFPLSAVSMVICHFPERRPKSYFYMDRYTYVVYNSKYTAEWIEKKWGFTAHRHIYPPVDMEIYSGKDRKENLLLSVARFEVEGTKRQKEMLKAFIKMSRTCPEIRENWKFVLAGGCADPGKNRYLQSLDTILQQSGLTNAVIKVNISSLELKELYKRAQIFWHLCGLNQDEPANVEHFGMTTAEAMQNRLVPVVFNGGGQKEIVESGVSGVLVDSTAQLISQTLRLIRDRELLEKMSNKAFERSRLFTRARFEERVKDFFAAILNPPS